MLPLAARFPRQPRLLLAAGALLRCLLHPRPVPGMAVLCLVSQPPQLPLGRAAWIMAAWISALAPIKVCALVLVQTAS
jgi:hypothetical protein